MRRAAEGISAAADLDIEKTLAGVSFVGIKINFIVDTVAVEFKVGRKIGISHKTVLAAQTHMSVFFFVNAVRIARVKVNKTDVIDLVRKDINVFLVGKRPHRGVGIILQRRIDDRLYARAVGGIGDAVLVDLYTSAEMIAALEKHGVARACPLVDLGKRADRLFGRKTVVFITAALGNIQNTLVFRLVVRRSDYAVFHLLRLAVEDFFGFGRRKLFRRAVKNAIIHEVGLLCVFS